MFMFRRARPDDACLVTHSLIHDGAADTKRSFEAIGNCGMLLEARLGSVERSAVIDAAFYRATGLRRAAPRKCRSPKFSVEGSGFWVTDLGLRVLGLEFRV